MSERVKTSLESEMEKLMSQASELSGTAEKSKENAAKTRRKSRDLEEQLSDMVSAGDQWAAVGMGRQRRASRDYTAAALKDAFTEIDADSSGYIDHAELEQVSTPFWGIWGGGCWRGVGMDWSGRACGARAKRGGARGAGRAGGGDCQRWRD